MTVTKTNNNNKRLKSSKITFALLFTNYSAHGKKKEKQKKQQNVWIKAK